MAAAQHGPANLEATPSETTIDALPDALLGLILAKTNKESWRAAAATSRRWNKVVHEDAPIPRAWSLASFHEKSGLPPAEAAAGRIALLQRVGRHMEAAYIDTFGSRQLLLQRCLQQGGWQLADVLGMLGPAALRSLQLSWQPSLPSAAVHALGTFSRLTWLTLQSSQLQAADAVRQLSQLVYLKAAAQSIPAALVEAIGSLPRLDTLELSARQALEPGAEEPLARLTTLRQLECLELHEEGRSSGTLQPPQTALFPNLRGFRFSSCGEQNDGRLQVCGSIMQTFEFEDSRPTESGKYMFLSDLPALEELQPLLEAALPAGHCPGGLEVHRCCRLPAAAVRNCPGVATLNRLYLEDCATEPSLEAVLALLRYQATAVVKLSLVRMGGGAELPPTLVGWAGLRSLHVGEPLITDLPYGPYLQGLEELYLDDCTDLATFPWALAAATSLRTLHLPKYPVLRLDDKAVDILLGLPHLALLRNAGASYPPHEPEGPIERLRRSRPELSMY
ncbi:hypothetical protein ABPG75_000199 [Micractinium tetrahymenae]